MVFVVLNSDASSVSQDCLLVSGMHTWHGMDGRTNRVMGGHMDTKTNKQINKQRKEGKQGIADGQTKQQLRSG